jgi:hypothetical protein
MVPRSPNSRSAAIQAGARFHGSHSEIGDAADLDDRVAPAIRMRAGERAISIIIQNHCSGAIRVRCEWKLGLSGEYDGRRSREIGLARRIHIRTPDLSIWVYDRREHSAASPESAPSTACKLRFRRSNRIGI